MIQVSLVGEQIVTHEGWDEAVEHVAKVTGVPRGQCWLAHGPRGAFLFERGEIGTRKSFAAILSSTQYQEARSRGDLEDLNFLPAHDALERFTQSRRTGESTSGPALIQSQETVMKKPSSKAIDKPEVPDTVPVYIVLSDHVMWGVKKLTKGQLITTLAQGKDGRRQETTYLAKGWIRIATPDEREAPPVIVATPQAAPTASADGTFQLLDPRIIAPSPVNPRRHFAEDAMEELVASVREKGVRVAINVRPVPPGAWEVRHSGAGHRLTYFLHDTRRGITTFPPEIMKVDFATREEAAAALPKYELIAGERRWRAARLAESTTIRAIVEHLDDEAAAELQVIENEQREDLQAMERAHGYKHLLSLPGYSMEKLVQRVGKAKNTLYGYLKLLDAPEPMKLAVEKAKVLPAVAEIVGRQPEARREKVSAEILRISAVHGQPLTVQAAKEVTERVREEEESEAARLKAVGEAEAKGLKVIAQSGGIISYGSELAHNCGYVKASDRCPRDPNGRTWYQVVKGQADVTPFAVVYNNYSSRGFATIPIYEREQVNAVLRKLGLWSAEGSAKSKELDDKRRQKEKHGRDRESMMQDLHEIDAQVSKAKNPRGALLAALWALTRPNNVAAVFVAKRRAWIDLDAMGGRACQIIRSLGTDMSNGELAGLVVELSIVHSDHESNYYREGRKEIRGLVDEGNTATEDHEEESAAVRTSEHPGEAVAA